MYGNLRQRVNPLHPACHRCFHHCRHCQLPSHLCPVPLGSKAAFSPLRLCRLLPLSLSAPALRCPPSPRLYPSPCICRCPYRRCRRYPRLCPRPRQRPRRQRPSRSRPRPLRPRPLRLERGPRPRRASSPPPRAVTVRCCCARCRRPNGEMKRGRVFENKSERYTIQQALMVSFSSVDDFFKRMPSIGRA
jgi:hypothetical protein